MSTVRSIRITIGCLVALSSSIFALTPGGLAEVQDLTRAVKASTISEQELRQRAVKTKPSANDMKRTIFQELIFAADSKGYADIFNPALVSKITAPIKTPQVVRVPTATVTGAGSTITAYGEVEIKEPASALPKVTVGEYETTSTSTKGKLEDILNQVVDKYKTFLKNLTEQNMTPQQIDAAYKEVLALGSDFSNKHSQYRQSGYVMNQIEQKLSDQIPDLYGQASKLVREKRDQLTKAAENPAPITQPTTSPTTDGELRKLKAEVLALEKEFTVLNDRTFTTVDVKQAEEKFYKKNNELAALVQQHLNLASDSRVKEIKDRLNDSLQPMLAKMSKEIEAKEKPKVTPAIPQPATPASTQAYEDLRKAFTNVETEYKNLTNDINNLLLPAEQYKIKDEFKKIEKRKLALRKTEEAVLDKFDEAVRGKELTPQQSTEFNQFNEELKGLDRELATTWIKLFNISIEKEKSEAIPQPTMIPTNIQALIDTYKNKSFTDADLDKLLRANAPSTVLQSSLTDDLNIYRAKTAEDIKKDLKADLDAYSNWNPKTIAFIYLRFIATKGFIKKYPKTGLSTQDVDTILQEFLSKTAPGSNKVFVQVLDLEENKGLLNPAKATVLSGASPERSAKPTTPATPPTQPQPQPAKNEFYKFKTYTKNAALAHIKKIDTSFIPQNLSSETAKRIHGLIENIIDSAIQSYKVGIANDENIKDTLMLAYYKAQYYMNDFMAKRSPESAHAVLDRTLRKGISALAEYDLGNGRTLADYLKQFEDSVTIPTPQPTTTASPKAEVTTTTQPIGTATTENTAAAFKARLEELLKNANALDNEIPVKNLDATKKAELQQKWDGLNKTHGALYYEIDNAGTTIARPLSTLVHSSIPKALDSAQKKLNQGAPTSTTPQPQPSSSVKTPATPQPTTTTSSTADTELKTLASKINKSVYDERPTLEATFGKPVGFGDLKGKNITLLYKHIFGLDFDENNKISGLHHDYQNQVANEGIIQFSNIRKNNVGCYSAILSYNPH